MIGQLPYSYKILSFDSKTVTIAIQDAKGVLQQASRVVSTPDRSIPSLEKVIRWALHDLILEQATGDPDIVIKTMVAQGTWKTP